MISRITALFTIIILTVSINTYSQDSIIKKNNISVKKPFLQIMDSLSLEKQFDLVTQSSDTYNLHKVIKFEWMQKLKSHVNDSILKMRTELTINNEKIKELQQNNILLQTQLTEYQELNEKKNNISFLGIPMNKSVFQFIMWALVIALGGLFAYYYHKFKQSHVLTRDAMKRYEDLDEEFRQARSRALEREQMLNRKLMDEINKNNK